MNCVLVSLIEYNLSYTHFVAPSAWRNVDILVLIELVGYEFFIFWCVANLIDSVRINFLWRVCVIILYFGSNFHKIFMESLILAQSERWRRA